MNKPHNLLDGFPQTKLHSEIVKVEASSNKELAMNQTPLMGQTGASVLIRTHRAGGATALLTEPATLPAIEEEAVKTAEPGEVSAAYEVADEAQTAPAEPLEPTKPLEVLLISEGTYPFHWGGVSTWCHLLIRDLPEVNFSLLGLVADPRIKPRINLLPNVVNFIPLPLWGVVEASELRHDLSLVELRRFRNRTTDAVVHKEFVPVFRAFLDELFLSNTEPERLGVQLHQMYRFFLDYDFDTTFRSHAVWNCFVEAIQHDFPLAATQHGYPDAEFSLVDVTQGLQWLYHWFFPLSKPLPQVDITHASMAGISTMIGVVAKLEYGAAFLLSEHGIYLRERYLAEADASNSLFLKLLMLRFARRMTDLSYAVSDQISPCCDYNQRWEIQNGASPDRLRTIYYGADSDKFYAGDKPIGDPPVVVWVGRINPLKDLFTLLQAAALVHEERPDITFRLYGNPPPEDQPYYEECLALRAKLGLEEVVIFAGYASNAATAYNEGDVVLLSSISEGFPFATLEAMLCGKPVVATSVGGLPEQIEGCGVVVEPRNPRDMADGVLLLMNDPALCAQLGKAARAKALEEFSVHQSREAYLSSYLNILNRATPSAALEGQTETQAALERAVEEILRPGQPTSSTETTETTETVEADLKEVTADGPDLADLVTHPDAHHSSHTPDLHQEGGVRLARSPRRKLQLLTTDQPGEWVSHDPAGIHSLAEEIIEQDAQPIDYLEVAALLESKGTTDEFALQHYGAANTFELAKAVLSAIHELPPPKITSLETPSRPARSLRQVLLDYAQGPVAFLPGLLVLVLIQLYGLVGQWNGSQIMALSLGMSGGLLMTNGFLQAVMRRASICLTLDSPRAAVRFLMRGLALAEVTMFGLAGMIMVITGWMSGLGFEERLIFCLAFLALSTIWLAAVPLALIKSQAWLGLGLGAGIVTGFAVERFTVFFSDMHLIYGSIVGFVVTLALIIRIEWRAFASQKKASKSEEQITLPSLAYLFYEATPYFSYGMLYAAFITLPHALGWFGRLNGSQTRQWAIVSLEVGLTLSLPPLVLVAGLAERTLRQFWLRAAAAQKTTAGQEIGQFAQTLLTFYRQQIRRYIVALALVSLVCAILVSWLLSTGTLNSLVGENSALTLLFFLIALVTYFLLGLGLFNCMFCVTLARPALAVKAVAVGIGVLLIIGLPFCLLVDFSGCLIAFIFSAVVFVALSHRMARRVLKSADYYYFAAF